MASTELLNRITVDPDVCSGKPCIRGHRVRVSLVLDRLAAGESADAILRDYPGLAREDILACIAYGSEMVKDRTGVGQMTFQAPRDLWQTN